MKKSFSFMLVLVVALSLALTACGGADNGNNGESNKPANNTDKPSEGTSDDSGKAFKISMVTDTGGVHDKSFNQSAWEALEQLKADTSANVKYLESKSDADMEPNLNTFINEGFDLTWGIGFLFADTMAKVAAEKPDARLAIIDNVVDAPNVASVTFAEHEGSYLVGVVAGLMTKTNKVGFIGGMEIPVIKRFEAGFAAGVASVNPDAKVLPNYVGEFNAPDKGKISAATLYNSGADIIFASAGATGNGVFNEAKDRKKNGENVWVIGVDKDQSIEFGDEITLTSMMKGVHAAVYKVSKDLIDGNWAGGTVQELGLKDNAVGLPEKNANVPEDVLAKVEEAKTKIMNGEVTVPTK